MATGLLAKASEWLLLSCHLALCPNRLFARSMSSRPPGKAREPSRVGKQKGHLFEPTHSEIYTLLHNDFEPDTKRQEAGKADIQRTQRKTRKGPSVPGQLLCHGFHSGSNASSMPNSFFICFFKSAKSNATKGINTAQECSRRTSETNQNTSRGQQKWALLHMIPPHGKQTGRVG